VVVGNAGELYRQQGDYAYAQSCYEQALSIAIELGDWAGILSALGNLAILLSQVPERYREAERLYEQAIALGRALKVPFFLCACLAHQAQVVAEQQRYAEAQPIVQEAIDLAEQAGEKRSLFQAHLLAIRLRAALQQADAPTAIGDLEALRAEWSSDAEQAAIDYTIWQLDAGRETSRRAAAARYRELYARTPNSEYRWRYTQLAGESLSDPPPLPPLPDIATRGAASLDELLARAERLIETAPWEQGGEGQGDKVTR
jgi:tetratricopeptide (TPR) repeat protein